MIFPSVNEIEINRDTQINSNIQNTDRRNNINEINVNMAESNYNLKYEIDYKKSKNKKFKLKEELLNEELLYPQQTKSKSLMEVLYTKESPIRLDRIKTLLILEAVMILDLLLEGNDKISSLIGVKK